MQMDISRISEVIMLPKKAIDEYKAIYKKHFGKDISDSEAEEQGMRLLRIFQIIYKPIPKSWLKAKDK